METLWEIDDRNHSNHDTDERNKYNRIKNGKTIGLRTNLYFLLNFNINYLEHKIIKFRIISIDKLTNLFNNKKKGIIKLLTHWITKTSQWNKLLLHFSYPLSHANRTKDSLVSLENTRGLTLCRNTWNTMKYN